MDKSTTKKTKMLTSKLWFWNFDADELLLVVIEMNKGISLVQAPASQPKNDAIVECLLSTIFNRTSSTDATYS